MKGYEEILIARYEARLRAERNAALALRLLTARPAEEAVLSLRGLRRDRETEPKLAENV